MAIALDASSQGNTASAVSSFTMEHTCSGADRLVWAFVRTSDDDNGDFVSGVTYDGVAMTRVAGASFQGIFGQYFYTYYLVAPNTTAGADVVITGTKTIDYGIDCIVQSYTGCSQTGVPDAAATNDGSGNGTISLTTVADNCWLAGGGRNGTTGSLSAGTGTTLRQNISGLWTCGDSGGAKTPAGSHSMGWTPATSATRLVMVSFAPVAVPVATRSPGGGGAYYGSVARF